MFERSLRDVCMYVCMYMSVAAVVCRKRNVQKQLLETQRYYPENASLSLYILLQSYVQRDSMWVDY